MAFHVTVHRRSDDALYHSHPEFGSEPFDRWMAECQARWVYDNPLGGDDEVFNLWHVPAHELGLPLLSSVYREGLRAEGQQLRELSRELDALESFWAVTDFTHADPVNYSIRHPDGTLEARQVSRIDHLHKRLSYLREAICLAEECDGVVCIG